MNTKPPPIEIDGTEFLGELNDAHERGYLEAKAGKQMTVLPSITTPTKSSERVPNWVPNTHHAVPQPAGHECAAWYEWANPSACDILYALAHLKGDADALRGALVEAQRRLNDAKLKGKGNDFYAAIVAVEQDLRTILAKHGR